MYLKSVSLCPFLWWLVARTVVTVWFSSSGSLSPGLTLPMLCTITDLTRWKKRGTIRFAQKLVQNLASALALRAPRRGFLALMLLAFNTRRMVRSAYHAPSPIWFTAQFNFAVSDRHLYEKIHRPTAFLVRWDRLISALVTTSSPRLKARAWCGDLCWDEPISPFQQCRMHSIVLTQRWLFLINHLFALWP